MPWGREPSYRDRTLRLRCYTCQGIWYYDVSWARPMPTSFACPVCATTNRAWTVLSIEWPDPAPGEAVMD